MASARLGEERFAATLLDDARAPARSLYSSSLSARAAPAPASIEPRRSSSPRGAASPTRARWPAVLLANGAWRDRPLEVPGVDAYVDRGLVYQNPLVYWFNHKNEGAYAGPRYEVPDGTLCVGGGLASIDVIKIIQLEIYERALRKRGIEATMLELEHEGIATYCKKKDVDPKSLGVTDGLLVYRRRAEDMPLADTPPNATPEQLKKSEVVRKKILEIAQRKFMFRFQERRLSKSAIVEGERLAGLTVLETRVEGRKVEAVAGSEHELRAPLVVSSIGSVPERIPGVTMKGETYTFKSWDTGEYEGMPGVFGLGNVVTGKGNIRESLEHGEFVAKHLVDGYLGLGERIGAAEADAVEAYVSARPKLAPEQAKAVLDRVRTRHREVGYEGEYAAWMRRNTPVDLE
jgi:ferredoxin--NADP+ reductase